MNAIPALIEEGSELPVAVIGGGPVGIAAAAHLIGRSIPVRLCDGGTRLAPAFAIGGTSALSPPGGTTSTRRPAGSLKLRNGASLRSMRCRPAWNCTISTSPRSPPLRIWHLWSKQACASRR